MDDLALLMCLLGEKRNDKFILSAFYRFAVLNDHREVGQSDLCV